MIMNDLERSGLRGKVKSMTQIEFQPISNMSDTISLKMDDFILAPNNFRFEYDSSGYLRKRTEFNYNYEYDSIVPKGLWTYAYDTLKRIQQEVYYWNNYSNDTTIWEYEYFGDSVTLVHKYDDTYKHMRYRYAQRKNLELLTTANADSSYLTRTLFYYDQQNRLIRKEEYEDSNSLTFIRSWSYVNTETSSPNVDVGISSRYNYGPVIRLFEYDSLENPIRERGVNSDKVLTTEYSYDHQGNWIEKRTKLLNDRFKITRRKIEYF